MPAFLVFFFVENEFRRKQANSKTGRPAELKQLFMPFQDHSGERKETRR